MGSSIPTARRLPLRADLRRRPLRRERVVLDVQPGLRLLPQQGAFTLNIH